MVLALARGDIGLRRARRVCLRLCRPYRLGAHGYTVSDVRGAGASGAREGAWEADRTVEIKIVCDAEVADAIAEAALSRFGSHYGLTMFFGDVQVLRPEKF